MDVELAIGGTACAALAAGHAGIGTRWVLPNLSKDRLSATPFGPPSLTLGMVRFSWHVVTIMLVAFTALLFALGGGIAEPRTLVLRWLGAFWLAATATACWAARRRPWDLIRFPVPLLMSVVAVTAWLAST